MGLVSRRVSDVSGEELDDSTYVNIVVRQHGKLDAARQIDVSEAEAKSIKTLNGLVELELRPANGEPTTVYCTETELAKVVPLEVLQKADTLRGRRAGFSPRQNGK